MKIVVLCGGVSTERDVSLVTGRMIYEALKRKGHQVVLVDVFLGFGEEKDLSQDIFSLDIDWAKDINPVKDANPDLTSVKAMRPDYEKNFFGPGVIPVCQQADVVFMALHGENGENGKIQACFDLMGIRYTGTDYLSSALAMDKGITKDIFRQYGVPTPAGTRLKRGEKDLRIVPLPCVVKAACGGSSVGVSIARTEEEYEAAKVDAFQYDNEVIIEQYIEGREFSVGVIRGKALPIIEIAPLCGFYDYKNKYQAGSTVETCPAKLSEEKTREMQSYAELGFQCLRMKGYGRLDFMMDAEGRLFCLEANTLPGMTPTSLLPQEAAATGMDFDTLCETIISISLEEA